MCRESLKSWIALGCAAVPILAGLLLWAIPGPQDQEFLASQASAVLQSALVLLGFRFVRKTSLPEGLALGYFWSFVEPLAKPIPQRERVEIGGRYFEPSQVRIEIWIPEQLGQGEEEGGLADLRADVEQLPEATFDTREHGLRTVRIRPSEDGVVMVDVPRNLDVLKRTLGRELAGAPAGKWSAVADRELDEFAARLARSLENEKGSFFRRQVHVRRPGDERGGTPSSGPASADE